MTAERCAPRDADDGSMTAFVALLAVALFAVTGLALDGGSAMVASQAATVEAEQAARAGAQAMSVDSLREGGQELDPRAAENAAQAFMVASGHPGTVTVDDGEVRVRVVYRIPTQVLGIVGIRSLQVTGSASAVDLRGVTRED